MKQKLILALSLLMLMMFSYPETNIAQPRGQHPRGMHSPSKHRQQRRAMRIKRKRAKRARKAKRRAAMRARRHHHPHSHVGPHRR